MAIALQYGCNRPRDTEPVKTPTFGKASGQGIARDFVAPSKSTRAHQDTGLTKANDAEEVELKKFHSHTNDAPLIVDRHVKDAPLIVDKHDDEASSGSNHQASQRGTPVDAIPVPNNGPATSTPTHSGQPPSSASKGASASYHLGPGPHAVTKGANGTTLGSGDPRTYTNPLQKDR